MQCKYCGGVFHRDKLKYCPYCDMELPEEKKVEVSAPASNQKRNKKWDLDKLSEKIIAADYNPDEPHGTVKVTVQGNKSMLSPATGSNYVVLFSEGAYQVRVSKGDMDISEEIELPVGSHDGVVRFYSWSDTDLKSPESERGDLFTINVKQGHVAEVLIKPGTILISRKVEVKYRG